MNFKGILTFFSIIIFCANFVSAQEKDSVRVYWLSPIEVSATKLSLGNYEKKTSKDNLSNILNKEGFSLIRKGVFFAQDIYGDGLKKGDINVTIDGEHYHSACPNRMDSPLTRVNTNEVETVDLSKSCSSLQGGLGGVVQFKRSSPLDNYKLKGGLTGSTGAMDAYDGVFFFEGHKHRVNIRYATGKPYEDANKNTFADNYNYKSNQSYKLAETSFQGWTNNFKYGASFSLTEDVSFPYLHMDERSNKVYSSFFSYKEHKIYFNYARHIMDNGFRTGPMFMETDATNLTIGAVGENYDVFFRNWDAENKFVSPTMRIDNSLIPNISSFSAVGNKTFSFSKFDLTVKLGAVYTMLNEKELVNFYKPVYSGAEKSRFFPRASVGINFIQKISDKINSGFLIEATTEAPKVEELYISVKRPMKKPVWTGNPELDQPLKASLRGMINYSNFTLEGFATNIWNYVNLNGVTINTVKYQTFKNINAYLLGGSIKAKFKHLSISANYTYAQNTSDDSPLSEIMPLTVLTELTSPEYYKFTAFAKHTFTDGQTRIDEAAFENTTPQWNRVDVGVIYDLHYLSFVFTAENITNEKYYQHLSYLRNPFSSNATVFEPGRTFRLSINFNQIL